MAIRLLFFGWCRKKPVHPAKAHLYYFAVIARNIEGDESDAAISCGAAAKMLILQG